MLKSKISVQKTKKTLLVRYKVALLGRPGLGFPVPSLQWDHEGRIEVVGGRLRMDDYSYDATYSLNEAILHLDLTGETNITLMLDHYNNIYGADT
jgi:hypothetical protein